MLRSLRDRVRPDSGGAGTPGCWCCHAFGMNPGVWTFWSRCRSHLQQHSRGRLHPRNTFRNALPIPTGSQQGGRQRSVASLRSPLRGSLAVGCLRSDTGSICLLFRESGGVVLMRSAERGGRSFAAEANLRFPHFTLTSCVSYSK